MGKKTRKWAAVTMALLGALLLSAWLAAPAIIEDQIRKKAAGLGASVRTGSVEVGLGRVIVRDVRIRSIFFPGQEVTIREAEVLLDASLNVEAVLVHKGSVELSGPWEELHRRYRDWKASRAGAGPGRGSGRKTGTRIVLEGFSLKWDGAVKGATIEAEGVSASKDGTLGARAERVFLKKGRHSVLVKGLEYAGSGFDFRADFVNVMKEEIEEKPRSEGEGRPGVHDLLRKACTWSGIPMKAKTSRFSLSWDGNKINTGALDVSLMTLSEPGSAFRIETAFKAEDVHTPLGSYRQAFATLKVGDVGKSAYVKLEAGMESVVTSHPVLIDGKIGLDHVRFEGEFIFDPARISVDKALLEVGKALVKADGKYDRESLEGRVSLDSVSCQDLLDAIPSGMAEKLRGMTLSGDLSTTIHLQVDLPERRNPSVRMVLKNGCRVESVPAALNVSRLKKPFKYQAYERDGRPQKEVESGPGSRNWVPLQLMSRFVPVCIRTMEDPGFWAHNGFHVEAVENSMKENIRTGRFVRGASTLSMQLAKNLWLQREKTASRKLQEAFLTMYLEQELTKERILELYVNIVEFGPDVYGIKAAAHHYFRVHPMNLTLGQSLFLASILPKPTAYYFLADGKLTPGKARGLRGAMKAMHAKGRISEDEYQEGIREVLVFRSPSTSSVDAQEEIPVAVDGIDPESWGD